MQTRREHRRVDCDLKCWCETTFSTAYLKMLNVSYGGCYLRTSIPFPPGETVSLAFQTPTDNSITVEAKVVWNITPLEKHALPPGMGLRFVSFQRGEEVMRSWLAT